MNLADRRGGDRLLGELGEHGRDRRAEVLPQQLLEVAARHGCHPLRGVANYEGVYRLTYLRGPSGILVMLAEDLTKR